MQYIKKIMSNIKYQKIIYFVADEYNPYCSKWGYCISYDLFGNEGPGQSKGAVEDGTRGQCRDDKDCTPWAPSCSPLGYCRGNDKSWEWDGSHGSPTNPKPGGKQSDWIKKNAKSGGARNEEYYGKIEDDNRKAHVKFRKENPIFYEQIPVLLPRLEAIEKNVYEPCTYCKYDPAAEDSNSGSSGKKKGNGRSSGASRKQNGNGRKKNKNGRNKVSSRLQSSGGRRQNSSNRASTNKNSGKRQGNNIGRQAGNGGKRKNAQAKSKSNGDCGRDCIKGCPSNIKVYMACAIGCGRRCNRK